MRPFTSTLVALAVFLGLSSSTPLSAFTFSAYYMTSWNHCDVGCDDWPPLSYTDDQIDMFDATMRGAGHTRRYKYSNLDVWTSDILEDNFPVEDPSGWDHVYADSGEVFAYAGHAECAWNAGNLEYYSDWCQHYDAPSCTWNPTTDVRLGERYGPLSVPNDGDLRWLILGTCCSVDTAPNDQWRLTLRLGPDMVFGYRGESADAEETDEVLSDFAGEVFDDTERMKASWFWAIEDWWIDDVGGVVASGTTLAQAIQRRDSLRSTWPRRPSNQYHYWFAWSWHHG